MCHPAVYVAIAGFSILEAKKTEKAQLALANAEFKAKQEQIKSNRAAVEIEALQKGNILSQQFQEKLAQNRAILASTGLTSNSMSFMANQQNNRSIYHTELNSVALDTAKKRESLSYASYDARVNLVQRQIQAKAQRKQTTLKAIQLGAKGAEGLLNSPTGIDPQFDSQIMGGINPKTNPFEGFDY